jgi:hypothetical protein
VVIAAAGDLACDPSYPRFNGGDGTPTSCRQRAVSDLLADPRLSAFLALGDTQYEEGTLAAFTSSFDRSYGRFRPLIRPAVGNHEYLTDGAAGYFDYFGAAAGARGGGYYSFDLGRWHLIALNSNCGEVGGCSAGSPQERWLRADLAGHPAPCTLAFWHHPRFSSGSHGDDDALEPIWRALREHGADVVLNGHDHDYERFAPQTPAGVRDDARGIREFISGTGGKNHTAIATLVANSEVRNGDTYGILELTLHEASYDWQFLPEPGKTFTDSGSGACH